MQSLAKVRRTPIRGEEDLMFSNCTMILLGSGKASCINGACAIINEVYLAGPDRGI